MQAVRVSHTKSIAYIRGVGRCNVGHRANPLIGQVQNACFSSQFHSFTYGIRLGGRTHCHIDNQRTFSFACHDFYHSVGQVAIFHRRNSGNDFNPLYIAVANVTGIRSRSRSGRSITRQAHPVHLNYGSKIRIPHFSAFSSQRDYLSGRSQTLELAGLFSWQET